MQQGFGAIAGGVASGDVGCADVLGDRDKLAVAPRSGVGFARQGNIGGALVVRYVPAIGECGDEAGVIGGVVAPAVIAMADRQLPVPAIGEVDAALGEANRVLAAGDGEENVARSGNQ